MRIFKLGLIGRIAALVIVVEIIVFSILGWFYTDRYSSEMVHQTHHHLRLADRMIADEELPISALSRISFMNDLLGAPYQRGLVIGGNGIIIVSSEPEYLGQRPDAVPGFDMQWLSPDAPGEQFIIRGESLTAVAHLESSAGLPPLYHTVITISTAELNATKNRIMLFGLLGSLLFIVLSSAAIIFIAQRFVAKRINASLDVVEAVEGGNLEPRIPVSSDDELGQLQHGINTMLDAVVSSRDKLRQLNENLERRVRESIEEIRQKDTIIYEQSKQRAMDELLIDIAHQWRQPLNALGLEIQDIKEAYEFNELSGEYIDGIVKRSMAQIKYLSETINAFKDFYKPQIEKKKFMISECFTDMKNVLVAQLTNHNIALLIEANDFELEGFKSNLSQAFMNIVTNAKDAILEMQKNDPSYKGYIKISIRNTPLKEVIIEDNGGGIADEVVEKVFTPYYSTKFASKGTGMGLYMAKVIVEKQHNGTIRAENSDVGARFIIAWPEETDRA